VPRTGAHSARLVRRHCGDIAMDAQPHLLVVDDEGELRASLHTSFGQKTQTYLFPRVYGLAITRSTS